MIHAMEHNRKTKVKPSEVTTNMIRGGQVGAYKDSVYEYKVTSNRSAEDVEEYCRTELHKCSNKTTGERTATFNGNCGFPFGLDSFYKFVQVDTGLYKYYVCSPYTG
ncbi:MAG: hypothetical protein GY861_23310 [bacterium]|nr:hypothetical protein [bacterium]